MTRKNFNYLVLAIYVPMVLLYIYFYKVPFYYSLTIMIGSFFAFFVYEYYWHKDQSHLVDHGSPIFFIAMSAPVAYAVISLAMDSSADNARILNLMFSLIVGRAISELVLDKIYAKK